MTIVVAGNRRSKLFWIILVTIACELHTLEVDYRLWLRTPGPDRHKDAISTPLILTDINVTLPCMVPKDNALDVTIRSGTIKASFDDHLSHFNSGTYGHQSIRKGQSLEDAFVYEKFFFGYTNGIIVESGALDGVKFSNTFLFDKFANWTAIHVEADPDSYAQLTQNRGGTSTKDQQPLTHIQNLPPVLLTLTLTLALFYSNHTNR